MTDSQLRQDIIDEFEFDPSFDGEHIGVAVDKNVVSLSGTSTATRKKSRPSRQRNGSRASTLSPRISRSAIRSRSRQQMIKSPSVLPTF
jgi:hypothetical protein